MFIVTGANGQLGHAIVKSLATLVPPDQIVASCRDPQKAPDLAALGVQLRQGDFSKPDSLASAFDGAHQLLIVSSNARAHGGDTLAQHQNAIAAAQAAGVERIVYTSHMAASSHSAFPPMHDHAATEAMLCDSGMAWTALRHGFYGTSGVAMFSAGFGAGLVESAADGPVSWTAHDDLAEAAARILTQTQRASGPTPPLTGSEALDVDALVQIASGLLAKPITRRVLSDDALRAQLEARGIPGTVVAIMLGFYIAARNGEFSTVDPTLAQLLGRPPISMQILMKQQIG